MSPSTTSQPAAQGELSGTPFAHLVLYIYQRRSSGTLVVDPNAPLGSSDDAKVKVLFHRGRAVAARVPGSHDALDQALLPLCSANQGRYEFYEEDFVGSGASIVTGMFDPYAFVTEAARHHSREETVDHVLSRYGQMPLCVQQGMDLERMGLSGAEARFAEVLRDGTATIASLCASGKLEELAARRLLYALLVTKVVGPFAPVGQDGRSAPPRAASGPSGLPVGPPSQAPGRGPLSADERRRQSGAAWAAIAARASQASRPLSGPLSPAPGNASTPAPRKPSMAPEAARDSSPTPSRAPSGTRSLSPSAASSTRTPIPGGERPSSKTPTGTRALPLRSLTPPGTFGARRTPVPPDTPSAPPGRVISEPLPMPPSGAPVRTPSRPISRVTPRPTSEPLDGLDDDGKYRRVLTLCQRNGYDEALPIIRGLVDNDRRNPAYLGLLASVLFGQGSEGTISKEIVETVNQALRIHPDEVHALYTKARCYKRMGKAREALHYFRRTVAVDPGHLEAAREVRLLMLRQNDKGKR